MDAVEDSGYGSVVKKLFGPVMILLAVLPGGRLTANEFATALERAREAGANHRYNEVIEILTPFNVDADPEDAQRELRQGVLLVVDDEHAQRICHRWRFQRTGRSAYRPVRGGS